MMNFINVTLLIIAIILTFLLYKKLITWYFKMKQFYKKSLAKPIPKNNNPEKKLLEGYIPENINVRSLFNPNVQSLGDILGGKDVLLVFMDNTCVHCTNNFEIFLDEAENFSHIKFIVIMKESQKRYAREMYYLYNQKIDILLGNKQIFKDFRIPFLPAFFLIDKKGKIDNVTPIPELAFRKSIR